MELASTRADLQTELSRVTDLETKLRVDEERSLRHARRLALAEREVKGLRAILATYDAEEKSVRVLAEPESDLGQDHHDDEKLSRIAQLEEMVRGLKAECEALEQDVVQATKQQDENDTQPLLMVDQEVLERQLERVAELEDG